MNRLIMSTVIMGIAPQFLSCNSTENETSKKKDAGQTGLRVASLEEANQAVSAEVSEYVLESYILTMAQIELSKTALDKSNSKQLKAMAAELLEDFNNLYQRINELADRRNSTLPLVMDKSRQKPLERLRERKNAADFDVEWVDLVEENMDDQIELNKSSEKIDDPELSSLIAESSAWIIKMKQQIQSLDHIPKPM